MATKNSKKSMFVYIFSCLCLSWLCICYAQTDTIKPGQVLENSDKLLVSTDGRFQLGFFSLGTNPSYVYLGIWYTNDTFKVWVANRDRPISGDKLNFTMDSNGLLKIQQSVSNPIELNSDQTTPSSSATLENSGNFVVKELNSDGTTKRVLWESFDNPTDTLLPGMKLGTNFKTGKKSILTSGMSDDILSPGPFSLQYNHKEHGFGELVMKRRGDMYWTSGIVTNKTMENVIWTLAQNFDYNFNYVSNENESYFFYTNATDGLTSRWILTFEGQLSDPYSTFSPIMVRTDQCYGFSSESGCVQQKSSPECRSSKDLFEKRQGSFIGTISSTLSYWNDNSSFSLTDCWDQCWKNCSCVGYYTINSNGTGCRLWNEGSNFDQDYSGNYAGNFVYVLNSTFPTNSTSKNKSGSGYEVCLSSIS